jgi:hypothetical protein
MARHAQQKQSTAVVRGVLSAVSATPDGLTEAPLSEGLSSFLRLGDDLRRWRGVPFQNTADNPHYVK